MHKVEAGGGRGRARQRGPHGAGLRELQRVPAHVRHRQLGVEALHAARQHAQAGGLGALVAGLEQQLHADADAEEQPAALDVRTQRLEQAPLVQHLHRAAKRTHARKYQLLCVLQVLW